MRYQEYAPSPILAPYIRCYWGLTGQTFEPAFTPERVLPDGCVELIIHFGDPFKRHHHGIIEQQPRSFIVGQITGPFFLQPTGTIGVLGIRFRPGGAYPFVCFPLAKLQNSSMTLDDLWGSLGRNLEAAVLEQQTLRGRIRAVERTLIQKLDTKRSNSIISNFVQSLVNANGIVNLQELSREAGISTRHLEREFNAQVGVTPKLLARILRFQRVFHALEQSTDGTWVSAAFACGYYDQAHLIRDFKQFAGITPSEFELQQLELARHFLNGKKSMSDFSKTLF